MVDNFKPSNPPVLPVTTTTEIQRMITQGRAGKRASVSDLADAGIELALRSVGQGNLNARINAALWGLNALPTPMALMHNTDQYGYVFFTRPTLNLAYDNCIATNAREFVALLDKDPASAARVFRAILDPYGSKNYPSTSIDPEQVFIALLSATCMSLSGWPDPNVDTYTSTGGAYKESWTMYDGTVKLLGKYTLNASFLNTTNDPISNLFALWITYGANVLDGTMNPSAAAIVQRYLDYQTRIYRIVMDYTYTKVQKIAVAEVAVPTTYSLGASFDFDRTHPRNEQLDTISVSFETSGVRYNDPITITEFNDSVIIMNPSMADGVRQAVMTRVPISQKVYFNCAMYPRIDPYTRIFEWWIKTSKYNEVYPSISHLVDSHALLTGETPEMNKIAAPVLSATSILNLNQTR